MLQYVAVCCSMLQGVVGCSVAHNLVWHVFILSCVAVCCRVLQCVAGCCRVLQGVAGCSVVHSLVWHVFIYCSTGKQAIVYYDTTLTWFNVSSDHVSFLGLFSHVYVSFDTFSYSAVRAKKPMCTTPQRPLLFWTPTALPPAEPQVYTMYLKLWPCVQYVP